MQKKTIGILGIGNTIMQDDGFGPHCVERLNRLYRIPENVEVLDGGTAGIMLAHFIEDVDVLYVIDTVEFSALPGSVHVFTDQDILARDIQTRMSPHQVGLMEMLALCKLRGNAPEQVEMLTTVPQDLSVGIGLSKVLEPVVDTILDLLTDRLEAHGVILERIEPKKCA